VLGFVSLYVTTYHVRSVQVNFRSVAYWSHIGGFVFGMVVAQLTRMDVQGHKDHMMNKVRSSLERGMLLDALRICDELVRYDPTDPVAQAELGHVWALLSDREQSIASYQRAIGLFMKIGAGDEAWQHFWKMRHFWPGARLDSAVMFRLSCYLEETGDYADAVESFKRLASESPESVEAQMALLKAGELQLTRMKDPAKSMQTLDKLVRDYPHSYWKGFAERLMDHQPRLQRPDGR
jgi:tetratricopeptide (TPR) repeat protein